MFLKNNKTVASKSLLLFIMFVLFGVSGWGQTIEFETIETGPYGRGSSIAVLFKPKPR